jgi:hypothetical protein
MWSALLEHYDGAWATYFVRASLLRFSKSWPVCAPLSLPFINDSDCRVAKTASLA